MLQKITGLPYQLPRQSHRQSHQCCRQGQGEDSRQKAALQMHAPPYPLYERLRQRCQTQRQKKRQQPHQKISEEQPHQGGTGGEASQTDQKTELLFNHGILLSK